MARRRTKAASWQSFRDRLAAELGELEVGFDALLDVSTIRYVNPNSPDSSVVFISAADWGWGPATDDEKRQRIDLGRRYNDWWARFQTLFDAIPPETRKQVQQAHRLLRRWIERSGHWDHDVPPTIDEAKARASKEIGVLREALALLAAQGPEGIVAVPDTSALLNEPDFARWAGGLGADEFEVVLLPTVIGELDNLKETARTVDVRDRAQAIIRRIKGLRDRGQLTQGVNYSRTIRVRAETREPDFGHLPDWLDAVVPDDRIVAGALSIQARNARAVVVLVTSDLNIQNKAEVARLPFVEPAP